ncbi:MAG: right-handed parallel beta-helix repeat-containing protein [Kiritimatiellae bacterium]|nr:right-handed parallel beta-helix repeat-containing protein [Kiritimatiellia bacterium]
MNVKNRKMIAAIALTFAAGILMSRADTHYVRTPETCTNTVLQSPYTSWTDAATNIQWAVIAAGIDGTVLVSNGTYNLTNQIEIRSNITVQSVNGTNFTFINGNYPAYTNRCVWMSVGTLDGFTVSNGFLTNSVLPLAAGNPIGGAGIAICGGATVKNCHIYKNYITNFSGGGICNAYSASVIISNCTVVGNTCDANQKGGGIQLLQGGVLIDSYIYGNIGGNGAGVNINNGGRMTNCTIAGNTARNGAGGVYLENNGGVAVANCVISNNSGPNGRIGGVDVYGSKFINSTIIGNTGGAVGGVSVHNGGMMSNCTVIANIATNVPGAGQTIAKGGVWLSGIVDSANVVANCIIVSNVVPNWWENTGVAGIYVQSGGLVKNCLIYGNTNTYAGGGVRLFSDTFYTNYPYGLINCTIVDNKAPSLSGIGATGVTNYIANCIVVSNVTTAGAQDNIYNATAANTNNYWNNCTPDVLAPNQGNITSAPLFVDRPNYNYRLSAGSPCINTGTNWSWTATDIDLNGRMRIRYVTVDMGAYEFIHSGTIYGFH